MDKRNNKKRSQEEPEKVTRAPLPKGDEIIGIVEQRLGGNKMMINCLDGKARNCRVPGRLKRELWLRPGDIVIVKPWEFDKEKADIILKYRLNQIAWLKKEGYLKDETSEF